MSPMLKRILPVAAGLVLLVTAGLIALNSGGDSTDAQTRRTTSSSSTSKASAPTTTTTEPTTPGFAVADAVVPNVILYSEPDVVDEELPWLANPTHEGLAVVFQVLEERSEYLKVRVSARPNGLVAWVKRDQVSIREVPNRILVEVGARRVTVLSGDDEVLLQETAAVGSDRTPTPLGHFFVDGIVDLDYKGGAYGAYQVSVSGFSDVLTSFGGGNGQIALHGTNRPDLLGQNISNGCVRLSNEGITALAWLAPTGTPVEIVA
ncbi:MAG: L,D-transpeptidase [Acidimicrobiales bacterium]|nr:L,D-transpeptidase [Acidimicrobiales bacterium]